MKTKLVLWGANAAQERVLIAMQLRASDNKVSLWAFDEAAATPEFAQKLLNDWRNTVAMPAPEGAIFESERELSVTEGLLPADWNVERADILTRAQSEWLVIVLSTKLHEAYKSELAAFEDKIAELKAYSAEHYESLKEFWAKVQEQVRDRNLFREHADALRERTNVLFAAMKDMRSALSQEFAASSQSFVERFGQSLDAIERKAAADINRFPEIFEELKQLQGQLRLQKLTKEHSNALWDRLDALFKQIKERRFGNATPTEGGALDRLSSRLEGLVAAMAKMKESIDRDKSDLAVFSKKLESARGQLEAQLQSAKVNMIQDRVRSKEEKYKDMQRTHDELTARMAQLKEKEAQNNKKATRTAPAPAAPAAESSLAVVVADAAAAAEAVEKLLG